MTETLQLLLLALSAFVAGLASIVAFMVHRQTRVIARRLHDALERLDGIARAVPEPGTPRDIDALRVEVEWLVDTLTNELTGPLGGGQPRTAAGGPSGSGASPEPS